MAVELKKVIWPSPAQTAKSTSATIAFVLLIAAILIILNLCFETINSAWWSLWQ
jgi:preprotein translocase SecE subunit